MSTSARATVSRTCPQCGNDTPEHDGMRRWCDHCNWNVAPPDTDADDSFLARRYAAIGDVRGKAMLARLVSAPASDLRPRLTLATATAFLIAAAIHLITLAALVAGLIFVFTDFPTFIWLAVGAALCGLGWLSLPRPMRAPKETLPPQDFPALHGLVNDIANRLGGKPVRQIVVDENFNASYGLAGWRREPVLHIGLPLWTALAPQQRIALVAHEIAHGVNGDASRGFVVGSAMQALAEWIYLMQGSACPATGAESLAGAITRVLALPLVALQSLLAHLLWQDSQRSEYFADYLAATVAGTAANVETLSKIALREHLDAVLLRNAYSSSQSGAAMLALFRQHIANLPEREWDRLRRASEVEGARLDSTHPPTAHRRAFLEAHRIADPVLLADTRVMAEIDAELRNLEDHLGHRLIARLARD